jgi:Domain of unknown function (DUF4406)
MIDRKIRCYIAGPMESAGGNFNFPLFDHVTKVIREGGWEAYSPAEHIRKVYGSTEAVLAMDKAARKEVRRRALKEELNWICDHATLVLLLPGWERSPGATAERAVALALGITVRELDTIVPGVSEQPILDAINKSADSE